MLGWLKRFCHSDEATESLGLVQLAAAGARPVFASPHECGFRGVPVMDFKGLSLGERLLPGLHWAHPEFECILWPQVTLRPMAISYRADYLVLLRKSSSHWLILELDGQKHDQEADSYRQCQLGLLDIRIAANEVRKFRFISLLMEELKAHPRLRRL